MNIPEDLIKEKAQEFLKNRRWRRLCLAILWLLPRGKLASRYFIYNKIEEWGFWEYPCNLRINGHPASKIAILDIISKTLYTLQSTDEFLKKEDLSRMSKKCFDKFCREKVWGDTQRIIDTRGVQSVFYLSALGRKKAKDLLFPPKKSPYTKQQAAQYQHP